MQITQKMSKVPWSCITGHVSISTKQFQKVLMFAREILLIAVSLVILVNSSDIQGDG